MVTERFRVPFKSYSKDHIQKFDRTKIVLTKLGKTFNLYDFIQAGREDTEIYPTLEKYGCLDKLVITGRQVFEDLTQAKDLRGLYDQEVALSNIFESLPLEERREFNHNFYEFKERGLEFYQKKAEAEIAEAKRIREQVEKQQIKPETGGSDNGQK